MILSVIFAACALLIFLVSVKTRFKFFKNSRSTPHLQQPRSLTNMAESPLPYPSNQLLSHQTNAPKSNATTASDCKYSYTTWCHTCERDSPRRRNNHAHQHHSTTTTTLSPDQPCKRRQKDMKSFNSRPSENDYVINENTNGGREYRMLGEYHHHHHQLHGDDGTAGYGTCCLAGRVGERINLCELPTTYISGQDNCQNVASCGSNCHHNLTIPTTGIPTYLSKGTNTSVPPTSITLTQHPIEQSALTTDLITSNYDHLTTELTNQQMSHQSSKTTILNIAKSKSRKGLESSHKIDINSAFYGTCAYLDRTKYNAEMSANLRDRYQQEMEMLRNKLKDLKSGRYNSSYPMVVKNLDKVPRVDPTDLDIRIIENVAEYKQSLKAAITGGKSDIKEFLSTRKDGTIKSSASRLSVKTRSKLSAVKLRKRKTKDSTKMAVIGGHGGMYGGSVSSSDFTESECSDSEAEYTKEEDISIVEESEPSTTSCEQAGDKKQRSVLAVASESRTAALVGAAGDQGVNWPLRESLFAHIPPYISFNSYDATSPYVLPIGKKYLKWKLSTITPVVVRKTLINTGFSLVRKSNDWCGTWGKHMKSPMFKTLKTTQKLNHFAGTFQIGRKDRLWRNMQRLAMKHGLKEFGFLPQTFVLPQDLKLLKHSWLYKNGNGGEKWIIKPPASARGVGIKVINKWSQLPKRMSLIVQRYISDPYLINGSKFDLRLYVLVTSFNPLRIYLYPDGLARFASAKYSSDDKDLRDRYMHLTNYSINKLSSQYTANEDANACQGHKWTLTKLWDYLASKGVNTRQIQANLHSLIIKTVLSGESPIVQLCSEHVTNRYNCYELFGVDVLLDADLRPWLLEVNISPSLHSASPLDAHVKGPLVKALMNLVQFHLPPRLKKIAGSPPVLDHRLYSNVLSKKERIKHDHISQLETREEYLNQILDNLTGDDVRVLAQAEDEFVVKGPFERIFPTAKTYKYLDFIDTRYYNRLFDAWECMFEKNRKPGIKMLQSLCAQKVHLKFPKESNAAKKSQSMINTLLANLVAPSLSDRNNQDKPSLKEPTDDETNDEETSAPIMATVDMTTSIQSLKPSQVTRKLSKSSPNHKAGHNQTNAHNTIIDSTVAIVA